MIISCWTPLPLNDQWDELVTDRHISWDWLISQHNEHRIFFPRLIFILDYWLASETNVVDLVCNLLVQIGMTVLILRIMRKNGPSDRMTSIGIAGLTASVVFWAVQWENFTWGFQVQFLGVVLGAVGTFATLAFGRPTVISLVAVVALEIVSVYTLSSGILVPVLTFAFALKLRRPRAHLVILGATAILLPASYLLHYNAPVPRSDPLALGSHPLAILQYMVTELGGPIAEATSRRFQIYRIPIATGIGSIGVVSFGIIFLRRVRSASPTEAILLALGCFLIAMALLTAVGRITLGLDQALSTRYATPAALFWLSTVLLIAVRHRTAGAFVALPLLVLIATSQTQFVRAAEWAADHRAMAAPFLLANVDDGVLGDIYPNSSAIFPQRENLRSAHTSVFADDWARWDGTLLTDHVAITDGSQCQGSFEAATAVPDSDHPGCRAFGRIQGKSGWNSSERVVLANEAGTVIGYGRGGFRANEVGATAVGSTKHVRWWIGAFTGDTLAATTAYVLLDDRTACPLGTFKRDLASLPPEITTGHPDGIPNHSDIAGVVGLEKSDKLVVSDWEPDPRRGLRTSSYRSLCPSGSLPVMTCTLRQMQ
jgi:hypothetical protein